jgi:hypothetical protein
MSYRIAGTYVAVCNCAPLCPCPVDGAPTAPEGECMGVLGFQIDEGNLDGTDLSGVNVALYNLFPSNLTSGNWKIGVVVDGDASDEQGEALGRIFSGQEGGPFGEFVPLIGEFLGVERAPVGISGGKLTVGDRTDVTFEAFTGPDGSPTTVKGAMFGFAPEYQVGKGAGSSNSFGLSFTARYGESAKYEFSTEATGAVHPRA